MMLRNLLITTAMLLSQAAGFASGPAPAMTQTVEPAPNSIMTVSYWGYVAFPPAMIGALVICGWLIPRKE